MGNIYFQNGGLIVSDSVVSNAVRLGKTAIKQKASPKIVNGKAAELFGFWYGTDWWFKCDDGTFYTGIIIDGDRPPMGQRGTLVELPGNKFDFYWDNKVAHFKNK